MSYYKDTEDYHIRGIDYDLYTCLECNPQEGFSHEDIKIVVAVWEGENDGDNWRWVLELNNGKFIYLEGGCDYTGWDCQSNAWHSVCDTPEIAVEHVKDNEHVNNKEEVYLSMVKQVVDGKVKTWSEKKDEEFGLVKPLFKNVGDAVLLNKPIQKAVKTAFTYVIEMGTDFECQTIEGLVVGKAGDYLAIGIKGEVYPIAKEIFEQSYEVVENSVDVITIGETKHLTSVK